MEFKKIRKLRGSRHSLSNDGKLVMESLSEIDQVAYVRFASVYKTLEK